MTRSVPEPGSAAVAMVMMTISSAASWTPMTATLPKKVGGSFRVFSGGVVVDQPLVGTQVVSFAQLQTLLAK